MLRLPDRRNLSFPCDPGVSDRHRLRRAVHRDHRDALPGILRARPEQRTQPDGAAGTEFQSRLDEDAGRLARWVEDAADPTAAVQEWLVPAERKERTMQAALVEMRALLVQAAAPLEQKVKLQQALRPWALPVSLVIRQPEALRLPLQSVFRLAGQQHADATGPVLQAH